MTMLVAFGFAACKDDGGKGKYAYKVTFDYNVGNIGVEIEPQYLGVAKDSLVLMKPGDHTSFEEKVIAKYTNEGWYLPKEFDENGEPVKDANGFVILGEKWDFKNDRVNENVTLYAKMVKKAMLIVKGGDKDIEMSGKIGAQQKEIPSYQTPKKAGATFYGYFEDEACTQPMVFPYVYQEGEKVIYAKFIEGTWNIVKTVDEFNSALATGKNIYLDADLDFTDKNWTPVEYAGEINGNNHKISNITLLLEASQKAKTGFGLFAKLAKSAYIHDVTIENVQATFNVKQPIIGLSVALLAYEAEEGAKLEKVTLSGELNKGTFVEGADATFYQKIAVDKGAVITDDCTFNVTVNN